MYPGEKSWEKIPGETTQNGENNGQFNRRLASNNFNVWNG